MIWVIILVLSIKLLNINKVGGFGRLEAAGKPTCGAGWHLPLAARVFISRREDRDEDCCGCRWVVGWRI